MKGLRAERKSNMYGEGQIFQNKVTWSENLRNGRLSSVNGAHDAVFSLELISELLSLSELKVPQRIDLAAPQDRLSG